MNKKLISNFLILILISQISCYSVREVTKDEVVTGIEPNELTIMMGDSAYIVFEESQFFIVNDTLKGRVVLLDIKNS